MYLRRRWFLLATTAIALALMIVGGLVARWGPELAVTATTLVAVATFVVAVDLWRRPAASAPRERPASQAPELASSEDVQRLTSAVGGLMAAVDAQAHRDADVAEPLAELVVPLALRVNTLLGNAELPDGRGHPGPATLAAIRSLVPHAPSRFAVVGAGADALAIGLFVASFDGGEVTVFAEADDDRDRFLTTLALLDLTAHVRVEPLPTALQRHPDDRWEFHTVVVPLPAFARWHAHDTIPVLMDQASEGAVFIVDRGEHLASVEAAWEQSSRRDLLHLEIAADAPGTSAAET